MLYVYKLLIIDIILCGGIEVLHGDFLYFLFSFLSKCKIALKMQYIIFGIECYNCKCTGLMGEISSSLFS